MSLMTAAGTKLRFAASQHRHKHRSAHSYRACAGVVLTQAVPNWVTVALLAVMTGLVAWRSIQKGLALYGKEKQHAKAREEPASAQASHEDGPRPIHAPSPFQAQVSCCVHTTAPSMRSRWAGQHLTHRSAPQ